MLWTSKGLALIGPWKVISGNKFKGGERGYQCWELGRCGNSSGCFIFVNGVVSKAIS